MSIETHLDLHSEPVDSACAIVFDLVESSVRELASELLL